MVTRLVFLLGATILAGCNSSLPTPAIAEKIKENNTVITTGDVSRTPDGTPTVKTLFEAVPMILKPAMAPPAPSVISNDSTLAGVDGNNNGIRDDVERWIAQTYPRSTRMRAAFAQLAIVGQKQVTVVPRRTVSSALHKLGREDTDAIDCILKQEIALGLSHGVREFTAMQFNTDPRLNALKEYKERLGVLSYKTPDQNTCKVNMSALPD